jgi:hypothetical protein
MTTPLTRAFFIGRAAAELLSETVTTTMTEVLSELGKFDAEQRVNLRNFVDQVNQRADQSIANTGVAVPPAANPGNGYGGGAGSGDLQATIDDLRAEIAAVRNELTQFRSGANP